MINKLRYPLVFCIVLFSLLSLSGCNSEKSKLDALVGEYSMVLNRRPNSPVTVTITQADFIIAVDDRTNAKSASYMFNDEGDMVSVIRYDDDDVIILRKGPMPDQWFVHNGGESEQSGSMVKVQ